MPPSLLPLTQNMRSKPAPMSAEIARQLEAMTLDMRHIARQMSENWARADDLVQDTLVTLWSQPDALDPEPEVLRRQAFEALRARAAARDGDLKSARDVA